MADDDRPPEIWIAFGTMMLIAALDAVTAVLVFRDPAAAAASGGRALGWVPAATAVVYVVLATYLLRRAAWARYGVIGLVGLSLALAAVGWAVTGRPPGCIALSYVVLLVLMFRPATAAWVRPSDPT